MTAVVRRLTHVLMQTVITENVTQSYNITVSHHVDMDIEMRSLTMIVLQCVHTKNQMCQAQPADL